MKGRCIAILLGLAGLQLSAATAGELSPDEIERLESLGYLDYGDAEAGPGQGVVVHEAGRSSPGYNLFTFHALHRAELIDAEGRVVRVWRGERGQWKRSLLAPNGDLLVVGNERSSADGAGKGERHRTLARLAWDGRPIWKRRIPVHHDLTLTPDGRIAALTSRSRALPERFGERPIVDNGIAVFSEQGELLEERSIYDMLARRPDVFRFVEAPGPVKGPGQDVLHANHLDWMRDDALAGTHPLYSPTHVVVTLRRQDTVAILDWERGEVIWAWGQGELKGPHDASLLENGNLLVFDNRARRKADPGDGWSRVVEVDPRTRQIVWEYRAEDPETFFSATRGTAQRLPNGNTLIGDSNRGRAFEVTRDGEVVWDYRVPYRDSEQRPATLRIARYPEPWVSRLLETAPVAARPTPD